MAPFQIVSTLLAWLSQAMLEEMTHGQTKAPQLSQFTRKTANQLLYGEASMISSLGKNWAKDHIPQLYWLPIKLHQNNMR